MSIRYSGEMYVDECINHTMRLWLNIQTYTLNNIRYNITLCSTCEICGGYSQLLMMFLFGFFAEKKFRTSQRDCSDSGITFFSSLSVVF